MTGILVVFVTVAISFVAIRVGAVAFEMTGLGPSAASFQALSAFTGTGFTTREAELIARHPVRRRIAMALMLAGHAGAVTGVAGMVSTLGIGESALLITLKLVATGLALYILYRVITVDAVRRWLNVGIRSSLERYAHIEPVDLEEVLSQQEGWGVFRVRVTEKTPCAGKSLAQTRLRTHGITVVAIERGGHLIPSPGGDHVILAGDDLIVYGRLDLIERNLGVAAEAAGRTEAQQAASAEAGEPSVGASGQQ